MRIARHPLLIKLFNWEYWPASITNIPVVICWLFYGLRSKDLFFFSAVNPVIETGGVFGESKINILNRIPTKYLPETVFVEKGEIESVLLEKFSSSDLTFPVIAKPDVGERGFKVSKINSQDQLINYHREVDADFIIQEFITYPEEISVLYYRFPNSEKGEITSLCIKETLKVVGDGASSVAELMKKKDRAILQIERFKKEFPELLERVPKVDELVELEPIGNHSRGTMFLNGNNHIDQSLNDVFDQIHAQMDEMWYGRFDMKCESLSALKKGANFKVLEFNGIASEPAHIYDPSYPLWKKYRDIFQHWKIIYQIGKVQRKRGVKSMGWKEAISRLRDYFNYMKSTSV